MSTFWCRNCRHESPHLLCGAEVVIDRQAILTVELSMCLVFLKMSSRFSIETNTILYFFFFKVGSYVTPAGLTGHCVAEDDLGIPPSFPC